MPNMDLSNRAVIPPTYRFSDPIVIESASNSFRRTNSVKSAYKFSEPLFIHSSTDNIFSASKIVPSFLKHLQDYDTFESLVPKHGRGKWKCQYCLKRNERVQSKCNLCGAINRKSSKAARLKKPVFPSSPLHIRMKEKVGDKNHDINCKEFHTNPSSLVDFPDDDIEKESLSPSSRTAASCASYNVFKSIVEQQKCLWWECLSCLCENSNRIEKCANCGTPKGAVPKDNSVDGSLASNHEFSFGEPSGGNIFDFVSEPENIPSFHFGCAASRTIATPTVTSTTSSTFGSSSSAVFKYEFGSSSSSTNASIFGSKVASKDEMDTGPSNISQESNDNISKSIRWDCIDCLTQNDQVNSNCVCCGAIYSNSAMTIATQNSPVEQSPRFINNESPLVYNTPKKDKSAAKKTQYKLRLSRRIKPTHKILTNEELRQGFEIQNNARLSLSSENMCNELSRSLKQNSLPFPPVTKTYSKTGIKKAIYCEQPTLKLPKRRNKSGVKTCERCGYTTAHGGHFNLHIIEGCNSAKTVRDKNCVVCCQPFSYNGLRYHLNQYVEDTSKANNGHQNFSPETHIKLLGKLKEEKKLKRIIGF